MPTQSNFQYPSRTEPTFPAPVRCLQYLESRSLSCEAIGICYVVLSAALVTISAVITALRVHVISGGDWRLVMPTLTLGIASIFIYIVGMSLLSSTHCITDIFGRVSHFMTRRFFMKAILVSHTLAAVPATILQRQVFMRKYIFPSTTIQS